MKAADLTLGILAGGRGLRLGGCVKALLTVGGRTLLERALDLSPLAAAVLVSVRESTALERSGVELVPDLLPGRGAPGGLVSLLLRARTPWLLAVAVDMPFFALAEASRLLAARGPDVDVVAASRGARLEPLAAVYRTSLGPGWRQRLVCAGEEGSARSPALHTLISDARCLAVEFPGPEGDRALENLNTRADLTRLGVRLGSGFPS